MVIVNIHEAKTHLSRLLERVRDGEEITIAKAGTPIADLVPHRAGGVTLGVGRGRIRYDDETFDVDNDEIADLFEGDGSVL
ncbi:prevent-host-death family protein [Kineosphaera limosa]|uniref:Antitoxin n=1 Tax=Kineosphaera limosa NBRC 100340 TaxID=1184609 RepID=K6VGK2_9MICO|nr:type II toxin-antitoxin system Phd/YefM family antitoxin [Kineosphaera limosa]NYE02111.1 prevent-host-death family protein [Kineosphaera limosa]GAB95288.1 hypothetical protein KILIM_018_00350 [Kineosphaera limosa NBRC 100340]